ncbi:MAG TPA: PilZ domain-containing protein [Terriglobia bacterium]|nr:PilZ domain-containing protein [Terriglobia bacterium]
MSQEQRSSARLPLELLAEVRWEDQSGAAEPVGAKTSNISGNGLFLTLAAPPETDTPITFTVFFPPAFTGTRIELVGRGHVVRSDRTGPHCGIAAVIEDYEIRAAATDA